jgi:hypothetical protein
MKEVLWFILTLGWTYNLATAIQSKNWTAVIPIVLCIMFCAFLAIGILQFA